MAKSSKGSKNGIVIKANLESFRILEIGQSGVRSEMNDKGTITGKYSGTHWDTVESQMNADGTSSWQVKFIQKSSLLHLWHIEKFKKKLNLQRIPECSFQLCPDLLA
jgi:hypothetical protein